MPLAADPHPAVEVGRARVDDLSPRRLHDLLQLRSAVFVVEQDCPFLDADGRDLDPATEHLWIDDDHGLVACARLLPEDGERWHLGRICTRIDARSRGLAAALVRAGLERARELGADRVVVDPGMGFHYGGLEPLAKSRHQARVLTQTFRLRPLGVPVCNVLPHTYDLFGDEFRKAEGFYAVLAALGGAHLLRVHEVAHLRVVLRALDSLTVR